MSQSTDGQICFGICLDEDYEYPWGDEDVEEWWCKVNGFKPSIEIYDADGNYLNKNVDSKIVDQYYREKDKFEKLNPIPFELINYCSSEYPLYILAVKSTVISASRGNPEEFNPNKLHIPIRELAELEKFCEKYGLDFKEAKWYLSSYCD